jgi:hypothetical protein
LGQIIVKEEECLKEKFNNTYYIEIEERSSKPGSIYRGNYNEETKKIIEK